MQYPHERAPSSSGLAGTFVLLRSCGHLQLSLRAPVWYLLQNLIEVVSHAQIRDPYYKFSRDPDMSLDTAPYPAGVPKPGMLAVCSVAG